jgi:hypothetical protein
MAYEGFVFYKSFSDAVDLLPPEQCKTVVQALCHYALYGEMPKNIDDFCMAMFAVMKPQIDANNKRREAGRKGGEANGSNLEADDKQTEANPKQTEAKVKEKDKVKDKVKDTEKEKNTKEKESDALAERSFSEPVKEALSDWLQYKREKRQSYQPTGLKQLFDGIETEINNRGEPAVIEGIKNSMQNNWQGIYYPNPKPQRVEPFDANAYLLERMRTG